jgi:hypothetical protein
MAALEVPVEAEAGWPRQARGSPVNSSTITDRASVATPLMMEAAALGCVPNWVGGAPVAGPKSPSAPRWDATKAEPVDHPTMDEPLWDASQTGSLVHQPIDDEWISENTRGTVPCHCSHRLGHPHSKPSAFWPTQRPPVCSRWARPDSFAADQETCETALASDSGGRQIPGMFMTMSEMSEASRKSTVTVPSLEVKSMVSAFHQGGKRGAAFSRGVRETAGVPRRDDRSHGQQLSTSAERVCRRVSQTKSRPSRKSLS